MPALCRWSHRHPIYTSSEVLFRYGHRSAVVVVAEYGLVTGGTEIVAFMESVSEESELCALSAP